jgi:hypothetical protein
MAQLVLLFVAITFLEMQNYTFSGHMVAVMALMEASNYRWCNFNSIIQ